LHVSNFKQANSYENFVPFIDKLVEILNFASPAWTRFPSLPALQTEKGVTGRSERRQVPNQKHEVSPEKTAILQENSVHMETWFLCA